VDTNSIMLLGLVKTGEISFLLRDSFIYETLYRLSI